MKKMRNEYTNTDIGKYVNIHNTVSTTKRKNYFLCVRVLQSDCIESRKTGIFKIKEFPGSKRVRFVFESGEFGPIKIKLFT